MFIVAWRISGGRDHYQRIEDEGAAAARYAEVLALPDLYTASFARELEGTDHFTSPPAVAFAAGWDAGDRSMRAAGRTEWNEDDFNVAVREAARLNPTEAPDA